MYDILRCQTWTNFMNIGLVRWEKNINLLKKPNYWVICQPCDCQWIGLRENINRKPSIFPLNQSIETDQLPCGPIWNHATSSARRTLELVYAPIQHHPTVFIHVKYILICVYIYIMYIYIIYISIISIYTCMLPWIPAQLVSINHPVHS